MDAECDWFFGSHGCDLPLGHGGDVHVCRPFDNEGIYADDPPDGGWSFDDCCFMWKRGDPLEFQIISDLPSSK